MNYDARIYPDRVEVGKLIDTGGVYYGPYNKVICIGKSDTRIVIHVKGHKQYWSQTSHYIPAHIIVFEVAEIGITGEWLCRKLWEKDCGRHSKKVQAEGLAFLK